MIVLYPKTFSGKLTHALYKDAASVDTAGHSGMLENYAHEGVNSFNLVVVERR